jgi:hypothetical protein
MVQVSLLIIYQRAMRATAFWLLHLPQFAGWLRQKPLAEQLKLRMLNKQDGDICTELNVERYDLRKDGNVGFSHPWGTHDDVYWSIALAVYATADMGPEPFLVVVPREQ